MKVPIPIGLFTITATLLSSLAPAQSETVGLTHRTPLLVRQKQDSGTCANRVCSFTPHQSQVGPFAGGTAYDGRLNAVWASNGTLLDVTLAPSTTTVCRKVCNQQRVPQVPNGASRYTTGMCYLESGRLTAAGMPGPLGRIYFSYDTPFIGWCDARGCVLANHQFCRLPFLSPTARIGGLACDDLGRYLFIGTFDPAAAATGVVVYVTPADTPCTPICKVQITIDRTACRTAAPLRSIAGLAFDECSRMLYVTDGVQTAFGTIAITSAGCRWTHRGCCRTPVEVYTGLAMLPRPRSLNGRSCTTTRCNTCPAMNISLTGEAILGNPSFRINLDNAPSNTSLAVLGLGFGSCVTPGLNLGFCANVTINPAAPGPLIFYFATPPSLTGCNTNLRIPAPIPVSRVLCNRQISAQWVVGCRPSGTGVTSCIDFWIGGI